MKIRLISGRIALLAALVLLLTGCASFLEGKYEEVAEHAGTDLQQEAGEPEGVVVVSNYTALKNTILTMVRNGAEGGTIRLQNYDGDPAGDISKAISEVSLETPLGAFAVEYFDHDKAQILSYYEVSLTINYKRTKQQIESIVSTYSASGLQEILLDTILHYDAYLVILSSSSVADESAIRVFLMEYYYANPLTMPSFPQITINMYPDTGTQRITEIEIEYAYEAEVMTQMLAELEVAAQEIGARQTAGSTGETALTFCDALAGSVEYYDSGSEEKPALGNTAYGALVEGAADSEGFALAFQALCGLGGIECYVVQGQLRDQGHFWNIINVDGSFYHVDPAMARLNGIEAAFLLTDSDMLGREYKWNTENYVLCEGTLTYYNFAEAAESAG